MTKLNNYKIGVAIAGSESLKEVLCPIGRELDAFGVLHHIMGWGIERTRIFHTDQDCSKRIGDGAQ